VRFLSIVGVELQESKSFVRLQGKFFYCRIVAERYEDRSFDRVVPVKVW